MLPVIPRIQGDKVNTYDRDMRYVVREKRARFDKQKQARNNEI